MELLARFLAQGKATSSVFIAERWPKEMQLPGTMLVRLPTVAVPATTHKGALALEHAVNTMLLRNARNAAHVKDACLRLQQRGFTPDVMYAPAHDGYVQNVRDVYPHARVAARLDCLYASRVQSANAAQSPLSTYEHMCNTAQLAVLMECHVGITASHWQKKQLNSVCGDKIRVVRNGVDTQFFVPPVTSDAEENVVFSCQGTDPARGIRLISESLTGLLTMRLQCRVHIISFAARNTDEARAQHIKQINAMLPPLNDQQRKRVSIVVAPTPEQYRALLQHTTLYVYLTSSSLLTAGLMEAMSCGALVLASDTAHVREIVSNGENGLLWQSQDAQDLAFTIAHACAEAKDLQVLRRNARENILDRHDIRVLLPLHAAALLEA